MKEEIKNRVVMTLKQHTPLIQFQGEQSNAVLRATEFKPKLDKFLKKYVFHDDFEQYKRFLIGYKDGKKQSDFADKEAFNYKVKFKNVDELKGNIDTNKFPFYFNNMGVNKDKDTNKFVFCESIDVEFFSLKTDLIKVISENIEGFLLVNNFGFRQNKGFGSFTLREPKNYLKKIKNIFSDRTIFYIKYDKRTDYKEIMRKAAYIYQIMKSGTKRENSFLFGYMTKRGIGNEKEFIKEEFFNAKRNGKEKKYVRSLLGVGNGIEFKQNTKGKFTYSSEKVERFQSPILFKVIDNTLIIIPQEMDKNIFDAEFEIVSDKNNETVMIKTPNEEEFSLEEFLKSFVEYYNKRNCSGTWKSNRIEVI